jgi:uncharacterized membrane protein
VWIALSLAAMGLMAGMYMLLSGLNRLGLDQSITLLCLFPLILLFNGLYLCLTGTPLRLPTSVPAWLLLAGAALASFLGNLYCLRAMKLAPNPGYPLAIQGCSVLIVTVVSLWLFASQLSIVKGVGVLLCTIGVVLICV